MTTHISYKTAKALKDFMGGSAPKAMSQSTSFDKFGEKTYPTFPRYQLHDLLSKPFCEVMAVKVIGYETATGLGPIEDYWDIALMILARYQDGGLPAVEKELMKIMKMMEANKPAEDNSHRGPILPPNYECRSQIPKDVQNEMLENAECLACYKSLSRHRPVESKPSEVKGLREEITEFIKNNDRIVHVSDDYEAGEESAWGHCVARLKEIIHHYPVEGKEEPLPTAVNGLGVIQCPHCFKPVLNDVKPTANASLVEYARREIKIAREQGNGSSFQDGRIYAFEEIISRYEAP